MHPTMPAPLGPFLRRVGPRAGLGRRPSASRRRSRRRRGGERPCRIFARCGKGEKGGRLSRCFPILGGPRSPARSQGSNGRDATTRPSGTGQPWGDPRPPCGFGGVGGCRWRPPRSRPPPIPHCSRLGGRRRSRAKGQREGRREGGRRDVLEPPVMLVELLFQAACVSLFLSSGQGRVYPARKKPASFAVERRRVGPHVCFPGSGSGCCPGWMLSPGSGKCTLPLCSFGCGGGSCIAPNLCMCPDGEQGITCPEPPGTCGEYGCDLSCNHGGCQEVARVCPVGFSMAETANGIRCTDIDECQSAACEGTCVNTEGGFACECGAGRELSADRRSCRDTDECQATPCQHRCENSVGSYRCSCRPGYHLHGNRHSCVDVDECRRPGTRRSCQHSCHNIPGSFRCSCRPGYRLSADRVSCEGYPKSILAPSPILQSLQHPPTLVLLPPGSHLLPRGSPSPHLPVAAPGTQFPPSSPSLAPEPSPRAMGAPGTSIPPSPHCWHRGISREPGSRWTEPGCQSCTCQGGQVLCDTVSCSVPCSHPLPAPAGGCCPTCTGCLHEGVARAEGDVFSPSNGNCTVCVCLKSAISGDARTRTEPSSAWMGTTAPPASAREERWSVPSLPAPCWIVPSTSGSWVPGSAAPPAGTLQPLPGSYPGCFLDDNGVEFPVGQIWSPGDPCRRLRELPAHGLRGDVSLSHPHSRAVLPRLLRRLHLHGEDLLQQRDLPVGAGSLPELHLPGKSSGGAPGLLTPGPRGSLPSLAAGLGGLLASGMCHRVLLPLPPRGSVLPRL
ncbi:von Willebrand factor C and EGF domain-containing protein isoform X5 [Zonotrichia albicollis]|uniref:von Willebrand factor C and EGF domain-containing protein isoform X5 n=1 Tax=Zonotrichia albicollis TaxID=44394 RepID=UPI003D80C413